MTFGKIGARKMMWDKPYLKRIQYLESTGTQYIDTGVSPSTSTVWQMRCAPTAMYCLMGCMNAAAWRFQLTQIYGGNVARAYLGYGGPQYPSYVQLGNVSLNQFHDYGIDAAEGVISMDGVSQPYPYDPARLPTSLTLWLFGSNSDNESYKRYVSARIADVKLSQDGVMVRDYIPVLDLNGEPKMFDAVTQSYPTHYGSFIAGPDLA